MRSTWMQLTLTDQDGTPRLTCELGGDLARGAERKAGASGRGTWSSSMRTSCC